MPPASRPHRWSAPRVAGHEALSVCFALADSKYIAEYATGSPNLSDAHALAVAQLLPVLLCGEESAALVFDSLTERAESTVVRSALASIAQDEYRHEHLLRGLRANLPSHELEPSVQRALRRFYLSMADRDTKKHLARIVALDSAVCILLGALRHRGKPLGRDHVVSAALRTIHRDEARHVRIAGKLIGIVHDRNQALATVVEVREGLIAVLRHRGDALECLQIDPDKIFQRLRRVSRGLFA